MYNETLKSHANKQWSVCDLCVTTKAALDVFAKLPKSKSGTMRLRGGVEDWKCQVNSAEVRCVSSTYAQSPLTVLLACVCVFVYPCACVCVCVCYVSVHT